MTKYNPITPAILEQLQQTVGEEYTLIQQQITEEYAHDAATKNDKPQYPEVVILPKNSEEIAKIIKLANQYLIPVTPRGGGSGLAGGAVALYGGILLDLARMNKIIHLDREAQYIVVEPSVRTSDLQATAYQQGFLYAGDPCSNDQCVIAGNIATNAGGNRAVKYGVTADQVYSLEIVTPLGEIVTIGSRLKKNATGYNLPRLLAGSEGTLGIVTKATLKLQPLAPFNPNYLVVMPDLQGLVALVKQVLADPLLDPLSLELIDIKTAKDIEDYQNYPVFDHPTGDCLIVQWEAYSAEEISIRKKRLDEIAKKQGSLVVKEIAGDIIWPARRIWGKAIEAKNPIRFSEDLVVPVDEINKFIDILEDLSQKWTFEFRIAGHAGDGNMHLAIIPQPENKDWEAALPLLRQELYAQTYQIGGRLSGEHGIGFKRKQTLATLADPIELLLMKAIKTAFDPNAILNPGKIFDLDAV